MPLGLAPDPRGTACAPPRMGDGPGAPLPLVQHQPLFADLARGRVLGVLCEAMIMKGHGLGEGFESTSQGQSLSSPTGEPLATPPNFSASYASSLHTPM